MYDRNELALRALNAVRPWESVDSLEKDYRGSLRLVLKADLDAQDNQKEIDKCLSCKRMYCTNCLDKKKPAREKQKLVMRQCVDQIAREM